MSAVHIACRVKALQYGVGVFAGERIHANTFIGIYAGEFLTDEEGERRGKSVSYIGRFL